MGAFESAGDEDGADGGVVCGEWWTEGIAVFPTDHVAVGRGDGLGPRVAYPRTLESPDINIPDRHLVTIGSRVQDGEPHWTYSEACDDCDRPAIAVGDARVWLVVREYFSTAPLLRSWSNGGWESVDTPLPEDVYPALAVDDADRVHLAWLDPTGTVIHHASFDPVQETWTESQADAWLPGDAALSVYFATATGQGAMVVVEHEEHAGTLWFSNAPVEMRALPAPPASIAMETPERVHIITDDGRYLVVNAEDITAEETLPDSGTGVIALSDDGRSHMVIRTSEGLVHLTGDGDEPTLIESSTKATPRQLHAAPDRLALFYEDGDRTMYAELPSCGD